MTQLKKRRAFFTLCVVVVAVLIILINPVPSVVSASEDAVASSLTKLNISVPVPSPETPSVQNPVDPQKLNKYMSVESAFLGLSDNVSIDFKDLNSGKGFSILPDKSWIPASIIKVFVAAEAYHQRQTGKINFNSLVTIEADNVVPNPLETDEFPRLREGTTATIGQLVQAMIIQSDNTAYNTLLDILDRRNIEAYTKSLGIENTVIGEKLNVDDNQERADSVNPGYQYDVTTAGDYGKLFDLIYAHKIPDSDELLSIFKRQKFNTMLPAMIPSDTAVAHKTGEWAPIYHDGGIVYKPGNPYMISIFSNSNNPSDIAKLSQIAYYQDASHVDSGISKVLPQPHPLSSTNKIYLAGAASPLAVLAASTSAESLVTAADLGVKISDLETTPTDQAKIPYTLITPASPLYGLKIFIENFRLGHTPDSQKGALALTFAAERLSELKSVSGVYNENFIQTINTNFQNNLKTAAVISEKSPDRDGLLLKSKEISDLHFMILGNSSTKIPFSSKEKFVEDTYGTLVQNEKEVAPIIKNSPLALATKTEPVIGKIQSIDDGVAIVTLDNGKKLTLTLNDATKVRAFNGTTNLSQNSLTAGDKIAVVGKSGPDGKLTPVFIMKNVPKSIPQTQGVVVEIQPEANLIKIENGTGFIQDVKVSSDTSIQAKDSEVSLEGIKAGSVITVTGGTTKVGNQTTVNADKVIIKVNGSGKNEKVETKSAPKSEKKPAPKPPQPEIAPPATPEPKR